MVFKFKGSKNLSFYNLTENYNYQILQFQKTNKYLVVYVIDNENQLICLPYISVDKFNYEWEYIGNDD